MKYEEAREHVLTVPWKVAPCHVGEECWCRIIVPVDPISPEDDVEDFVVINAATINQKTAEHIVRLHNASLK